MQYNARPDFDGVTAIQGFVLSDCKTRKYQVRKERLLDDQGEEVDYFDDGDRAEIEQVPPGSTLEAVVKFACKNSC